jgi:hypothetical protein
VLALIGHADPPSLSRSRRRSRLGDAVEPPALPARPECAPLGRRTQTGTVGRWCRSSTPPACGATC